jgi:hypothetical protein
VRSRGDEDVPRVRVGVEVSVAEELVEHDGRELGRHRRRVDVGGAETLDVVDLDRRDIGEGQHASCGALPRDLRRAHARIAREVLGEAHRVARLVEVVDLFAAGVRELFDQHGQVDVVAHDPHAAEPLRHASQGGEVDVDDLLDAGSLHLQDDVGEPGVGCIGGDEAGPVGLAEGCRCHRHRIDPVESGLEWDAELGFSQPPDRREVDRGHLILKPLELFRDLGGQHIEARRHELADLDHQSAELDSEAVEVARQPAKSGGSSSRREAGEPEPREEQLEPPRLHHVPGGETQDPAITRA